MFQWGESTPSEKDSVPVQQPVVTVIGSWRADGLPFETAYWDSHKCDVVLAHNMTFRNTQINSIVDSIGLLGYKNGEFVLVLSARNKQVCPSDWHDEKEIRKTLPMQLSEEDAIAQLNAFIAEQSKYDHSILALSERIVSALLYIRGQQLATSAQPEPRQTERARFYSSSSIDEALRQAAREGNLQKVKSCLAQGARADTCSELGRTALINALGDPFGKNKLVYDSERYWVMRYLLQDGTSPDNEGIDTALQRAVWNNDEVATELLLLYKSDTSKRNLLNERPYDYAINHGYTNIVRLFERHGYFKSTYSRSKQGMDITVSPLSEQKGILTKIIVPNQAAIISILTKTCDLREKDRQEAYELFRSQFTLTGIDDKTKEEELSAAFAIEFPAEQGSSEMYCNMIYRRGRLVGFTTFDVKEVKYKDEERIVANLNISVANKDITGLRLASFYSFYYSFVLDLLYPNKPVDMLYIATTAAAFGMGRCFDPYPLYGNEQYQSLAKELIAQMYEQYGGSAESHFSYRSATVCERLTVKNTQKRVSEKSSLVMGEFCRHIRESVYDEAEAAVPVLVPVDAERLGVFKKLVPGLSEEQVSNYLEQVADCCRQLAKLDQTRLRFGVSYA